MHLRRPQRPRRLRSPRPLLSQSLHRRLLRSSLSHAELCLSRAQPRPSFHRQPRPSLPSRLPEPLLRRRPHRSLARVPRLRLFRRRRWSSRLLLLFLRNHLLPNHPQRLRSLLRRRRQHHRPLLRRRHQLLRLSNRNRRSLFCRPHLLLLPRLREFRLPPPSSHRRRSLPVWRQRPARLRQVLRNRRLRRLNQFDAL